MATFENIADANATIKTTRIGKKDYAEVNQRIKAFRMVYPEGFIISEIDQLVDGLCIFRARVGVYEVFADGAVKERVLGTGTAYEKEGSSQINRTSYIENCVPLSTQILTAEGWKYYYQLKIGEKVLSYNMSTHKNEYCRLTAVNVYKDRSVLEMSSSRFSVRCTHQHKWVGRTQYKDQEKVATENLTSSWKIIQAMRQDATPTAIGRQLGWLMCDCDVTYTADGMISTAYINQSKHYYELDDLFGEGRQTKKYKDEWLDNFEWAIPAEKVRSILGHFGMATYKDLPKAMLTADIDDVAGCYNSMMLADGSARGFSSTYPELIDAMQIMCARLGIATTFVTRRMCEKSTKPIYTLGIKKTSGAWFSELDVKNLPPQDVWCPTTENGTWIMRQNGFVTLTSNCETSAIGRALGMAGFGIDTSVASAEEVENAIHQQEQGDVTITRDNMGDPMTEAQKNKIFRELDRAGFTRDVIEQSIGKSIDELTKIEASNLIERLMKR